MSLNGDKFLDRMSDVDHRLIVEADKAKKTKPLFLKAGLVTVAAAAAAAVGLNFLLPMLQKNNDPNWTPLSSDELPDLPMLDLFDIGNAPTGMGYEGFSRSQMEERTAKSDKLRQSFGIREMPVYKCGSADPDGEKMRARLRETAEYFGLDYDSLEINDTVFDEEAEKNLRKQFEAYGASEEEIQRIIGISRMNSYISAYDRDGEGWVLTSLSIDSALTVSINLTHPVPDAEGYYSLEAGGIELPSEYNFNDNSSPEELEAAGRYLLDKFSELTDMENPVVVTDPEYDGYVEFYEKGADDAESIANQSIKHVGFSGTDDGKLGMIRIFEEYKHCEKIADYPIANLEQATELLKSGRYLTSSPYELTGGEEIAFAELTYRSGIGYSCVMPFYRFLVRMSEEYDNEGEEHYAAYYVPAVREEYLGDLDEPAISFNGGLIK